ncbi:hypothetical protein [Paucibacter sp. DJ2R-2]|uniref:hypothetical protein n=1 Tax=Paucibacter sp. DJ2R-2 TaxID=2893558 RepID=UPI0021E43BB3|nr:hypothetical protein [Paucibacter sp. DJ2R-2]MCV2423119.1 hypothetical protein [Paucibacter sp. DJ4R-1]MCV2441014.1 hypothetical protein [Paucibacter sp. DJ2R-2]
MSRTKLKTGAALLAAASLGWFLAPGGDQASALVQARRDPWVLAELPRKPDLVGVGLAMVTSPIFGQELQATGAVSAPENLRWRISGVFQRGTEKSVLVSFLAPGKQDIKLRVGESLPSGHKIVKIEDSEVCVQIGKKAYRLGVEYRE